MEVWTVIGWWRNKVYFKPRGWVSHTLVCTTSWPEACEDKVPKGYLKAPNPHSHRCNTQWFCRCCRPPLFWWCLHTHVRPKPSPPRNMIIFSRHAFMLFIILFQLSLQTPSAFTEASSPFTMHFSTNLKFPPRVTCMDLQLLSNSVSQFYFSSNFSWCFQVSASRSIPRLSHCYTKCPQVLLHNILDLWISGVSHLSSCLAAPSPTNFSFLFFFFTKLLNLSCHSDLYFSNPVHPVYSRWEISAPSTLSPPAQPPLF